MKRTLIPIIIILLALVLISIGIVNSGVLENSSISEETSIPPNTIIMNKFTFLPNIIEIKKGTTLTWINPESAAHKIVSDSGMELDSDILAKGDSFSHTFNKAGTYDYHCSIHSTMKGTVIVR